ncbi:MAG: NAD-dependent deacylase [Chloroflexi bacterium]|nr:NAD-dependent deacylase [Chloroflexota bacterium]
MKIPEELIAFLKKTERIAVLTGAGISAESGLKTFRDAQDGHWAKYRPEDLATPEAFARDPKLVWDWYAMRRNKAAEASPNPAHFALVEMEQHLDEFTLITQNVDGYHIQAGSKNVLELHGNIQRVKCFDGCGVPPSSSPRFTGGEQSLPRKRGRLGGGGGEDVPRCPKCNAYLRPDVVWFGESLSLDVINAAHKATLECQAFFSIGTSALVQPAASLAYTARQRGAIVVEINLDPTPLTSQIDFALHGKAGEILPDLVEKVWG